MTRQSPASRLPGHPEGIRPIAQAFGLLAAALLVLALLYGLYAWHLVRQEGRAELRAAAAMVATGAESLLARQEKILPLIAEEVAEAGGTVQPEAASRALARFVRLQPELEQLDLFGPDERHVASSAPASHAAGDAVPSAAMVGTALERARIHDGLQLGAGIWTRSDGRRLLPAALRVVDPATGHTAFFLVEHLDPVAAGVSVSRPHLPAEASVALLTGNGTTLLRWPAAGPATGPAPARADASGFAEDPGPLDGRGRFHAVQHLERHALSAWAALPRAALWLQWFRRVRIPYALLGLGVIGLVFAATWTHRQQRQREVEQDVTEAALRDQDLELRRQSALLAQTQRAAHVGGWELDVASGRMFWTEETYRLHDIQPDTHEPSLESSIAFYAPDSRELIRAAMDKSVRGGQSWDLELQLVTARGRSLWVRVTGVADLGPAGTPVKVFGAIQDVTERHRTDERIRRLAHYDELTGLANRNLMSFHLAHVLLRAERYGKKFAVLFVDLDRFKIINDTLGHDTGDMVLKTIAGRLSEHMRAADLVARLGGDEFMVVIEEFEDQAVIEEVAQKLLRAIEQPVQHDGHEFSLTASIGIAVYPQDGRDQQSLLKHADIAMYRAKDRGKNCFEFYSSVLHATTVDRLSLESRLKRAVLEQNQFVLHYQPKLSLPDGRIVGVEALVRWVSPERGLVPPAEFIPLAEETGLIGSIGEWVFASACAQAAEWAGKGLRPVTIGVNLSARQLYSPGFLDGVRKALETSGVAPGAMELEITESMMMQDVEQVAGVLGRLKALGVHVAVDDFGTGYSSLAYLKRLPLDALKVDRSFIRDLPGDADDEAITRAVVALAHSLRLRVVAEGVETREQLDFLRELGCDEIQGFLFSKPVPAAEFEDMLRCDLRLDSAGRRDAA